MLPINSSEYSGSVMSSNCVVWQGRDLPCIELCKGDTVSTVVYKVASQLCTIMDELDLSNYDMSCFGLGNCTPDDFNALIQLLIEKICLLESNSAESSTAVTEDTYVNIAECFQVIDSQTNGTIKQLTIKDYVIAIGKKFCSLYSEVNSDIKSQLDELKEEISYYSSNSSSSTDYELLVKSNYYTDKVNIKYAYENIDELVYKMFNVLSADGTSETLKKAAVLGSSKVPGSYSKLGSSGTFSDDANWVNNLMTIGANIKNIWVVLADLYKAVGYLNQSVDLSSSFEIKQSYYNSTLGEGLQVSTEISIRNLGETLNSAILTYTQGSTVNVSISIIGLIEEATSDTITIVSDSTTVPFDSDLDMNLSLSIVTTKDGEKRTYNDTYIIKSTVNSVPSITISTTEYSASFVINNPTQYNLQQLDFAYEDASGTITNIDYNHTDTEFSIDNLSSSTSYNLIVYYNNLIARKDNFVTNAYVSNFEIDSVDVELEEDDNIIISSYDAKTYMNNLNIN